MENFEADESQYGEYEGRPEHDEQPEGEHVAKLVAAVKTIVHNGAYGEDPDATFKKKSQVQPTTWKKKERKVC